VFCSTSKYILLVNFFKEKCLENFFFLVAELFSSSNSSPISQIDWANIPTPPRFIHERNDPITYFSLQDYKGPNGNGRHERDEHQNGINHLQHFLKPKVFRCVAIGIPRPE